VADLILAFGFVFVLGYTVGVVITRLAAQRREERRMRRHTSGIRIRAPRAPQAVRREVAHG
jgi:hypothetical protein